MTLEEIRRVLDTTGYPVTYRAWPEGDAPALPFICYLTPYSDNFAADNGVYLPIDHIRVELYTAVKSRDIEIKVEAALSWTTWERSETYINSEKCYQITYEIEV